MASVHVDPSEYIQADGSGLSRLNFVSPRTVVSLLTYMTTRPDFPIYYDSLPIAGVDGTLTYRMKNTAAAGNCHAKTGSLGYVSTISGYVTDADGSKLVFSILMNSHSAPAHTCAVAEDQIITLLAGYHSKSR